MAGPILDESEQLKYAYEACPLILTQDHLEQTLKFNDQNDIKDLKSYYQGFLTATFTRTITNLRFLNFQPPMEATAEYDEYIKKNTFTS